MSLPATGEGPYAPAREGVGDWLTFAFATPEGETCGAAEIELTTSPGGDPLTAGHALLLREGAVVAAQVEGPAPAPGREWRALSPAGVRAAPSVSGERWSVAFRDPGGDGFELEFAGVGVAVELDPGGPFARATRTEGRERVCRVTGSVTAGGRTIAVEGLGQHGHRWGAALDDSLELVRRVDVWLDDDLAVVLAAARTGGDGPDAEAIDAFVLEGEAPVAARIEEARLSTTYDAARRPVRASLELWPGAEAEMPRRAAGRAVATAVVPLGGGRERLSAFFAWWMEGRAGVGHYALVRRV